MGICASSPTGLRNNAAAIIGLHRDDIIANVLQAAAHCTAVHFPSGLIDGEKAGVLLTDGTVLAAPTLQDMHTDPSALVSFLAAISPELAKPAEPNEFLDTALELVATLSGLLVKAGGPPQKKMRQAATPILKRFQAVASKAPRDPVTKGIMLSPLSIIVSSTALCWLLPACAYMRWFRPLETNASEFAGIASLVETVRALSGWREASAFEAHWLNPAVIPRPGAMAVGPMQHASMRYWIKVITKDGKDIAAKLRAAVGEPKDATTTASSAAAGTSSAEAEADTTPTTIDKDTIERGAVLARRFGWFAKLLEQHSIMEDRVIYPTLEKTKPGCSKTAGEEHDHEIPIVNKAAETAQAASDKMVELLGDSDTVDASDAATRAAVEDMLASLEGEHGVVTLEPAVELHFKGEERDIFPVMQSVSGKTKKEIFKKALAICAVMHADLLAFVVGGLNPAVAEQYMWGLHKHGAFTTDEWRERVGYLKAGVAQGKITRDKYASIYKRTACVRDFAEE